VLLNEVPCEDQDIVLTLDQQQITGR